MFLLFTVNSRQYTGGKGKRGRGFCRDDDFLVPHPLTPSPNRFIIKKGNFLFGEGDKFERGLAPLSLKHSLTHKFIFSRRNPSMLKLRRTSPSALKLRRVNKVVMVRQAHHEGGQVLFRGSTMFCHGSFHIFMRIRRIKVKGILSRFISLLRGEELGRGVKDRSFKEGRRCR